MSAKKLELERQVQEERDRLQANCHQKQLEFEQSMQRLKNQQAETELRNQQISRELESRNEAYKLALQSEQDLNLQSTNASHNKPNKP